MNYSTKLPLSRTVYAQPSPLYVVQHREVTTPSPPRAALSPLYLVAVFLGNSSPHTKDKPANLGAPDCNCAAVAADDGAFKTPPHVTRRRHDSLEVTAGSVGRSVPSVTHSYSEWKRRWDVVKDFSEKMPSELNG